MADRGEAAKGYGEEPTPTVIADRLGELAERLERTLPAAVDPGIRRELARCLDVLQRARLALRRLAPLFDAPRAEALARREEELKSIILAAGESLRSLVKANRQMAGKVGTELEELDAIMALPPGEELVKRLRNAALHVRHAASELGSDLDTTADTLGRANERIVALERDLDEARQKALYDGLTRLHCRAVLDERLKAAVGAGEKDGSWSFLIADLDRFKTVNDRYGHVVGDALLFKVARVIESALRQTTGEGFLARYGGEEFAILLPGATLARAGEVAERIRESLATMQWEHSGQGGWLVIQATISIGVAQYRPSDTVAGLVERADQALYRAKSEGRNRVALEAP